MSTVNELLKTMKAAFFGEPVPPVAAPVAPTLAAPPTPAPQVAPVGTIYKTKDGIELNIIQAGDKPATGDMVTIAGVAAPAGEYILEDDSVVTVDQMGMITVFTPGAPVTTGLTVPQPPTFEERLASLENAISKLNTPSAPVIPVAMETQLNAATEKIEKHNKTIKELFELVEKLVKEPTADPVTLTGDKKEKFEKLNRRDERLKQIAETIAKNKVLA